MKLSAPIRGLSVALLLAGCASPPPAQVVAPAPQLSEAEGRLAALEGCPPFGDVDLAALGDLAWTPPPSAIDRHRELRAAGGAELPQATPRILTRFTTFHHESTDASLAAVRGEDGIWRVTAIGESRGISADQPPSPIRQDWALSAEASAEVDAILVDPCFYAEPTRVHAVGLKKVGGGEYSIVGGGTSLMEVETGERSRIAEMHFGNWGKTGRLMQLIASRSS